MESVYKGSRQLEDRCSDDTTEELAETTKDLPSEAQDAAWNEYWEKKGIPAKVMKKARRGPETFSWVAFFSATVFSGLLQAAMSLLGVESSMVRVLAASLPTVWFYRWELNEHEGYSEWVKWAMEKVLPVCMTLFFGIHFCVFSKTLFTLNFLEGTGASIGFCLVAYMLTGKFFDPAGTKCFSYAEIFLFLALAILVLFVILGLAVAFGSGFYAASLSFIFVFALSAFYSALPSTAPPAK